MENYEIKRENVNYSQNNNALGLCRSCVQPVVNGKTACAEHRREIKAKGSSVMYRWLRNNNYPPIMQVLCANCQLGKLKNNGTCPHLGVSNV